MVIMLRIFTFLILSCGGTFSLFAMETTGEDNKTMESLESNITNWALLELIKNSPKLENEPKKATEVSGIDGKQEISVAQPEKSTVNVPGKLLPDHLDALITGDTSQALVPITKHKEWIAALRNEWTSRINKMDLLDAINACIPPDNQKEIVKKINSQFPVYQIIAQAITANSTFTSTTLTSASLGKKLTSAITILYDIAYIGCEDGTLVVYDLKKKSIIEQPQHSSSAITSLAINKEWLFIGREDGSINKVDRLTKHISSRNHPAMSAITTMALSNNTLAFADENGTLQIYGLDEGSTDFDLDYRRNVPLNKIIKELYITNNRKLIIAMEDNLIVLDLNSSDQYYLDEPSFTFISDDKIIGKDKKNQTWTTDLKTMEQKISLHENSNSWINANISYLIKKIYNPNLLLINKSSINIPLFACRNGFLEYLMFCNLKKDLINTTNIKDLQKIRAETDKLILIKKDNSFEIIDLNISLFTQIEQFFAEELTIVEWELLHGLNNGFITQKKIVFTESQQQTYETLIEKIEKKFNTLTREIADSEFKKHIKSKHIKSMWTTNTACTII